MIYWAGLLGRGIANVEPAWPPLPPSTLIITMPLPPLPPVLVVPGWVEPRPPLAGSFGGVLPSGLSPKQRPPMHTWRRGQSIRLWHCVCAFGAGVTAPPPSPSSTPPPPSHRLPKQGASRSRRHRPRKHTELKPHWRSLRHSIWRRERERMSEDKRSVSHQ